MTKRETRQTMQLVVQLSEWGEALTERVADLTEGLPVVVGPLEQGSGVVRLTLEGDAESLVLVALRLADPWERVLGFTQGEGDHTTDQDALATSAHVF